MSRGLFQPPTSHLPPWYARCPSRPHMTTATIAATRDDAALDIGRHLRGRTLILLSNREPYEHERREPGEEVSVRRPAGGLVSALDPTMQRTHGIWVAWGSGTADRDVSEESGRVQVPPDEP